MRHWIAIVLFLVTAQVAMAQQTPAHDRAYYLAKAKKQKTAAWLCLGSGAVIATTGIIIGINRADEEFVASFNDESDGGFTTGAVFFFTGAAAMLTSVPLFIASSRNHNLAIEARAMLKWENGYQLASVGYTRKSFPALGIQLRF